MFVGAKVGYEYQWHDVGCVDEDTVMQLHQAARSRAEDQRQYGFVQGELVEEIGGRLFRGWWVSVDT